LRLLVSLELVVLGLSPRDGKGSEEVEQGAIAYLDILGWKDIWRRKNITTDELIDTIRKKVVSEEMNIAKIGKYSSEPYNIAIRTISDTIVIYIHDSNAIKALNILANHSASILTNLLEKELPVRGAISYGDFDEQDNIVIGPAIAEVASWYELADWIGIILTPSAAYSYDLCDDFKFDDLLMIKEYEVPIKNHGPMFLKSINWPYYWINKHGSNSEKDLKQTFLDMGPITIDIAKKFKNTERYFKCLKESANK
jgi:hypothetical protein